MRNGIALAGENKSENLFKKSEKTMSIKNCPGAIKQ